MASTINASTSAGGGIIQTADASGELALQAAGSTIASVASTGVAVTGTVSASSNISTTGNMSATGTVTDGTATLRPLVRATAQATNTGATSYEFTGIPSWVRRITVMFSGITMNTTTVMCIQLGSTTYTTSGYLGASWPAAGGAAANSVGFGIAGNLAASNIIYASGTLTNISGNTWVWSCAGGVDGVYLALGGGNVTIGGVLDRVRLTTTVGTAAYDGGSVNIMYE
jgi:hypothetical protein